MLENNLPLVRNKVENLEFYGIVLADLGHISKAVESFKECVIK